MHSKMDRWGLMNWCGTQRVAFKEGDMFPERARKLLELGFPIVLEKQVSWMARYNRLKGLTKQQWDNLFIDPAFERWVELQRVLIDTDSLPSDRKGLLEEAELFKVLYGTEGRGDEFNGGIQVDEGDTAEDPSKQVAEETKGESVDTGKQDQAI